MGDAIETENYQGLSAALKNLLKTHPEPRVKLGDMAQTLREGGIAILLMVFSAPTALPLPAVPGVTFILSLPMILLSIQIIIGRHSPWLPHWAERKSIKQETLTAIVNGLLKFMRKLEMLIKPRLTFLSKGIGERFIGLIMLVCSCSVALPFPFTNTIPSMGVIIMALGLLQRDGLVIVGGMLVGLLGVTLAISVYLLGAELVFSYI